MDLRKAGQIALFRFPYTDFSGADLRPALLIKQVPGNYEDWLVCMITSQLQKALSRMDEIISQESDDYHLTGLKNESVIRVTRLAIASASVFRGSIGEISDQRLNRIKRNLSEWILTP